MRFQRTTEATLLEGAWADYRHSVDRTRDKALSEKEAWLKYGETIEATWRAFIHNMVPVIIRELTELFNRKWGMRRSLWTAKGGWLFTKRGTRRKRWTKKLRQPRRGEITIEIDSAYYQLNRARAMEKGKRYNANRLTMWMLPLTGVVTLVTRTGARVNSLPLHERLLMYQFKWPWQPSVKSRLDRLVRDGLIERWDKNGHESVD